MESLNLNMLASSLPNSNLANAEKDLTNNFKAAALSLTTLYRSSRRTSKRAYNAGYAAACQDLLVMIQQGVSTGESSDPNGNGGMTIGRVMDYVEARLEAIKSREDEEDEDEEREKKEKERSAGSAALSNNGRTGGSGPSATAAPVKSTASTVPSVVNKNKESTPLTPHTPPSFTQPRNALQFVPSSPTPSTSSLTSPLHISTTSGFTNASSQRSAAAAKAKLSGLALGPNNKDIPAVPFTFANANAPFGTGIPTTQSVTILPPSSHAPLVAETTSAGTKRRHTAMLIDSAAESTTSHTGTRRRTRSSRGNGNGAAVGGLGGVQDQNVTRGEAMDVEDEGRERKRVARR